MKKLNKTILWVVLVVLSFFVIVNVAFSIFVRPIVVSQIEKSLKMRSSLRGISISFPLTLNLDGLEIGNLFKAQKISLSLNPLGLLGGKVLFSHVSLISPLINLEQAPDGTLNLPKLEKKGKPPEIYVTSLSVRNARLIYTDKKISASGFKTIIGRVNIDIYKVAFPLTSLETKVRFSADFLTPSDKKIGSLLLNGWFDFGPKNMDMDLKLDGLDVTYFSPYYGNFISNKKLLSANLDLKTKFKSKDNNLDILTNFRLSRLNYAQQLQQEGELPELDLTRNALDLFTDAKGNLILDFDINTKMDNPNVSIEQLKRIILKAAAKNLANQSPEDLIKKVNDNIEQFKAFGKSLEGIFKGK